MLNLHAACATELLPSDVQDVKALLKNNPRLVCSKDPNGATPLHLAAKNANKVMVELLLANETDVNARDNDGLTPLHEVGAVYGLQTMFLRWVVLTEVIELLLANGANVDAKDNYSRTPLHHSAAAGSTFAAELFVAKGADVNAREDKEGLSPSHAAAAAGSSGVVQLLLANGADVNAVDNEGWTPLRYASAKKHNAIGILLVQHGGR